MRISLPRNCLGEHPTSQQPDREGGQPRDLARMQGRLPSLTVGLPQRHVTGQMTCECWTSLRATDDGFLERRRNRFSL